MFLQMRKLREALGADVALEWSLARVRSKVDLQVRQLSKGLTTDIALIMHLAVLLLKRVRQRPVTPRALRVGTERSTLRAPMVVR